MSGSRRAPLPQGFGPLWTTVALDLIGFGIVIPILAAYATDFGASGFDVGLLIAFYSLAQFVFSPLWGRLSDRVGRRPVLIISLIGSAIGSLLTGLAGGLVVLYIARIIDGASGATVAVAQAAATDLAEPDERPRLLGLLGAAFALGFVIGPAIGGLAGLVDRRLPFFIAAGLAACNVVATWIRVPETHVPHLVGSPATDASRVESAAPGGPVSDLPGVPRQWIFMAAAFSSVAAFAGFEATFALIGEDRFDWSISDIAFVFVAVGIYLAVIQGRLVGVLSERYGSERLLTSGLGLVAVGLIATGAAQSPIAIFGALVILVAGQGLVSPSMAAVVAARVGARSRGGALGDQQAAGALGRVAGPVTVGGLYAASTQFVAYSVAAAAAVVALVLVTRGLSTQSIAESSNPVSVLDVAPSFGDEVPVDRNIDGND